MIDWNKPLITKHNPPRQAILMPSDGVTTRRRVFVSNNSVMADAERKGGTVWLLSEDGVCRVDGRPSANDVANGEARL